MIRFRTGDIGYFDPTPCECGRTMGRIHILGRKDEMFIVSAVNVFPSDIEYIVRKDEGLSGEYRIRVYDENFTTRYEVSVERVFGSEEPYDQVARRVEEALKTHTGVRPAKVLVYDADGLGVASEHKASRFIDERGASPAGAIKTLRTSAVSHTARRPLSSTAENLRAFCTQQGKPRVTYSERT